ncbi:hypothetical protein [Prochlorothrix hollandica]|uniref:hypothetical protein n=1 Tax=Prochlorothrix hollandica TaxID=1223 RepID=UPI000349C383|nr:hypothetical protein [Prochlorothrix hollandica]
MPTAPKPLLSPLKWQQNPPQQPIAGSLGVGFLHSGFLHSGFLHSGFLVSVTDRDCLRSPAEKGND